MFGLAGLLFGIPAFALPPLQLFVEITPPGGVLRPPPGSYSGPLVIRRPIRIEGGGKVTLDGGGEGTVLRIEADDVTVRGLRIINSGRHFDDQDAGIRLSADNAVIESNRIEDTLFGINLHNAANSVIRGNYVSSIAEDVSLRGEGLRLWYSVENLIEGNAFEGVRDLLFMNSPDNQVRRNRIRDSRIGMEFVFSPGNLIEGNRISRNTTGIVGLYSDELEIRGNRIMHLRQVAGSALAIKESSQVVIEDNEILHCTVGMITNSPTHPENVLHLRGNRFAYNDVGLYFYGEKGGHELHGNYFEDNLLDVAVSASSSALDNDWSGNHWDNYQGFDLDQNGIGDTPYQVYLYADRIWLDRPMTRFFRSSPVLELIDFVERLAPFSDPKLILQDPEPRVW